MRLVDLILDAIKRGGLPIRQSPKWNEFWSTTMDGWLYGGNAPGIGVDDSAQLGEQDVSGPILPEFSAPVEIGSGAIATVGGQPAGTSPLVSLMGSFGKLETEGGELGDLLQAPTPSYGNEDEMGFVEG